MQRDRSIKHVAYNQFGKLVNESQSRFKCCICHLLMTQPTQTGCGCRFCLLCIEKYLNDGGLQCPSCHNCDIDKSSLIKDRAVEKEISNLSVQCNLSGCTYITILKDLNDHLIVCEFREEKCENCEMMYQHTLRQEHLDKYCMEGLTMCDHCGIELTKGELLNMHRNYEKNAKNICEKWNGKCPYECNDEIIINIRKHLTNCPNRPIECLMKQLGCTEVGSRDSIEIHMQKDFSHHQILMVKEIHSLSCENVEIRKMFDEKEKKLMDQVQELRKTNSDYITQIRRLNEKLQEMEKGAQSLTTELDRYKQQHRLQTPLTTCVVIGNDHVIWTITDIRVKIEEAKLKNKYQIVSENFYITRPGYNMTMKIYPNGDGSAKDNYLSAYFVINKGEYDNEVSWPFKNKVTLCLLNRFNSNRNINVHMKPDSNPACYERPLSGSNVGAGQPEFVKLQEILSKDWLLHDGALKLMLSLKNDRPFSTI